MLPSQRSGGRFRTGWRWLWRSLLRRGWQRSSQDICGFPASLCLCLCLCWVRAPLLPDRQPGLITPVACWARARRKLRDVYRADPHSVAAEGLKPIRELYDVERGIACDPDDDRRKARKLSRLRVLDFFAWADGVLGQISARSPLAETLRYAVKLNPHLLAYTEDERLASGE